MLLAFSEQYSLKTEEDSDVATKTLHRPLKAKRNNNKNNVTYLIGCLSETRMLILLTYAPHLTSENYNFCSLLHLFT